MTPPGPDTTGKAHAHAAGEHCSHCGSALHVERSYDVKDRFARSLLSAVCRSMGLEAYARSKGATAPIYVRSSDAATLDRMWARFTALVHPLDDQLLEATRAYIKEHCGLDPGLPPPR